MHAGQAVQGTIDEPSFDRVPVLVSLTHPALHQSTSHLSIGNVPVLSPLEEWFLPEFNLNGHRVYSRHERLGALCYLKFSDLCGQLKAARAKRVEALSIIFSRFNRGLALISFDLEALPPIKVLRQKLFIDQRGLVYAQAHQDSHRSAGFYLRAEMAAFVERYGEDFTLGPI